MLLLAALLLPLLLVAQEVPEQPFAAHLTIDGPIGPATADYLGRSLDRAVADGARVALLRLDTPGGLDASMRQIIQEILRSPIPVATYVAPRGARAASAGTYILYASHVAAMSPATTLGAATPVQVIPGGAADETGDAPGATADNTPDAENDESANGAERPAQTPPSGDAMTRKVVEDAAAYIRGLAELRGRNAEWAERAVREAVSLDAREALELNVIDYVVESPEELLDVMDGREVEVGIGPVVLDTANLALVHYEPDWRNRLLAVITNPNVAYLLMLIGIYGLILEFANPGTLIAGITGAICLLLALYAFQILPINYAGLALMLLGVALMIAEAFAPSFGALGIGGVAAFVFGSMMLMDTEAPGFEISIAIIGAFALASALVFIGLLGMVWRARHRPVVSGMEELAGARGRALEDFDTRGPVWAHGERWTARTTAPVKKGEYVRIIRLEGLTLEVTPERDDKGE